jgi:hypothetical protein
MGQSARRKKRKAVWADPKLGQVLFVLNLGGDRGFYAADKAWQGRAD